MTKRTIFLLLLILLAFTCATVTACDIFNTNECGTNNHIYNDIEIVLAPTCTEPGVGARTCTVCGHKKSGIPLRAKGHDFGNFQTPIEPTCTTEGLKEQICSVCGTKNQHTVAKIDHRLDAPETIENPTCTNEGKAIKRCAYCDYTETITLPKNAHNYVETARTEPTCTEQGNKQTTCDGCGDVQNTALDKLGHTFGDKPQYGYDYLDSTDPELCFKKYRKCRRCSQDVYYMAQSHSLTNDNDRSVAATCTKTGIAAKKCQRCNYLPETQITPIDPTRHVKVVEKNDPVNEATCMERHFGECQDCLTVVWEMGQTAHDYDYSTFECKRNTCSAVHEASIAWFNYSNFNYGFAIKSVKEKSIPELLKYLQKT